MRKVQFGEDGGWGFIEVLNLCGLDVVVLYESGEMVLLGHVEVFSIRRKYI